jgi:hypothetical protein
VSGRDRRRSKTQEDYRESLRTALNCLNCPGAAWIFGPPAFGHDTDEPLQLLHRPDPLVLRADGGTFRLSARQTFRILPRALLGSAWRVSTQSYEYTIYNSTGAELIAWHWHPRSETYELPHVHINVPVGGVRQRAHVPTGRTAFEDVVRFALHELRVGPAYDDWEDRLRDARDHFNSVKTW